MPPRRKSKTLREAPFMRSGGGNQDWVIPRTSNSERFRARWEAAIVRTDPITGQDLAHGVDPITRRHLAHYDHYWECPDALRELQPKWSALSRPVQYFLVGGATDVIGLLWKEASVYATHLNEVVRINKAFRRTIKAIGDAEKAVQGAKANISLEPLLRGYASSLNEMFCKLEDTRREYWTEQYSSQGMRPISEHVRLPKSLSQDRNLDTQFQTRAGDLLRSSDPSLSLETISRLVVLAYICADLVEESKDKHLIILGSDPNRKLTVASTYDKLRKAGLSLMRFGNPRRKTTKTTKPKT